ncbi:hypothetical protein AMELA_G00054100 [Ameiurus melas]|uniref:Uncharacterized protein n=1 Tax=Ameiurus melas TaxID=219545 RepID=A0A7J6B6K6_AMEME|nr:hypothetical protein AMELA_G00054100 [Ameiurus melas]
MELLMKGIGKTPFAQKLTKLPTSYPPSPDTTSSPPPIHWAHWFRGGCWKVEQSPATSNG